MDLIGTRGPPTSTLEPVANLPHGQDVARLEWVFLEFLPELRDMSVDSPCEHSASVTPDLPK